MFLWDVTSGVTDRRLPGHMGKINVVDFNEDATVLASGTWHKSIYHSEFMNFAIKDPLTRLSDSGTSAQCLEPPYRCWKRPVTRFKPSTWGPHSSLQVQSTDTSGLTTYAKAS